MCATAIFVRRVVSRPIDFVVLGILAVVGGCHRASVADGAGDTAAAMRRLTVAYAQYAAQNRGAGPANHAALVKFLMQRDHATKETVEAFFISPRDQQPFVVRWGQRPLGSMILGPDPPTPEVIVVEATSLGGERFVADGQGAIRKVKEEEVAKIVSQPVGPSK